MPPFDFFYSDPHFGHANIIQHSNRPFRNVEHMNRELEARFQATLEAVYSQQDYYDTYTPSVLWLGDCAWSGFDLKGLLARLPARHFLVRGNHDKSNAAMLDAGFEFVAERLWVPINGRSVVCCHFPPLGTTDRHDARYDALKPRLAPDAWAIHGHTHEHSKMPGGRRVHVGVDAWDYAPAPWADVAALIPPG